MTVQHNPVWVMRCGNSSPGPRWRDSSPEWHSSAQPQTARRPPASLCPPSSAHLQPELQLCWELRLPPPRPSYSAALLLALLPRAHAKGQQWPRVPRRDQQRQPHPSSGASGLGGQPQHCAPRWAHERQQPCGASGGALGSLQFTRRSPRVGSEPVLHQRLRARRDERSQHGTAAPS